MKAHSKKSILFNKIDIAIGKKLYGNTTGFTQNVNDRKKVLTKVDETMKNAEPELYSLIKNGFTEFPSQYDESLIKNLQNKFQSLIEDDTFSFAHSGYKEQDFGRIIRDPSKVFPEISKLITKDVLALVTKYYKTHFTISNIQCGRNYYVPSEIRKNFETFSNFWHNDKDPVSQFKYFVYLTNVTEKDGPFHAQTKDRTTELIKMGFGNRFDYKLSEEILEDPKYLAKMMGPAGTSFFASPPLCLHRAGDPEKGHFRDLIQFTFDAFDEPIQENWIDTCPGTPSNIIPKKFEQ
jgi:hypothetical protein